MSKIALSEIARALDAVLDAQMAAQARVAAHLVAAAEAGGDSATGIVARFDAVKENTVLDEVWVTNEDGAVYITTVRDQSGELMPFQFIADPAVQPQASQFYPLLQASPDDDKVITQEARVREIDQEVYKYVGVSGVDRHRIVQVGNAIAFTERADLSDAYTSPVMTAVLAAFDDPELLSLASTDRSQLDGVRAVFDEILGEQIVVQVALLDSFVDRARTCGWSTEDINGRLQRIVDTSAIEEIHIVASDGSVPYSNLPSASVHGLPSDRLSADDLTQLLDGTTPVVDKITEPGSSEGMGYRRITMAGGKKPGVVQVCQSGAWPDPLN